MFEINPQKQPYDTSLKTFLRKQMAEMLRYLVPGASYVEELNTDIFKPQPALRADKACKILHNGVIKILHIEVEVQGDSRIQYRMNSYAALLLEEYDLPVISVIIYPFETVLPKAPLIIKDGDRILLQFDYSPLGLWTLEAERFIREQAVAMYPLLLMMHGVTVAMLLQVIKTMAQTYEGIELSQRLVWFRTLLSRTKTLSVEDKRLVEEELSMFDELLENDPWIKQREERAAEQEKVRTLRDAVITVVRARFPNLVELAQPKVMRMSQADVLQRLVSQLAVVSDEGMARGILDAA